MGKIISVHTWASIAFILIFAQFALPGYLYVYKNYGIGTTSLMIWGILLLTAIVLSYFCIKKKGTGRFLVFLAVCFATLLISLTPVFETPGERIHIFLFGMLALFLSFDLFSHFRRIKPDPCRETKWRGFLLICCITIIVCLLTAVLDETMQSFMPERVGQAKDVLLAVIGWGFGYSSFLIFSI